MKKKHKPFWERRLEEAFERDKKKIDGAERQRLRQKANREERKEKDRQWRLQHIKPSFATDLKPRLIKPGA